MNVLIRLEDLQNRARAACLDFGGPVAPASLRMLCARSTPRSGSCGSAMGYPSSSLRHGWTRRRRCGGRRFRISSESASRPGVSAVSTNAHGHRTNCGLRAMQLELLLPQAWRYPVKESRWDAAWPPRTTRGTERTRCLRRSVRRVFQAQDAGAVGEPQDGDRPAVAASWRRSSTTGFQGSKTSAATTAATAAMTRSVHLRRRRRIEAARTSYVQVPRGTASVTPRADPQDSTRIWKG